MSYRLTACSTATGAVTKSASLLTSVPNSMLSLAQDIFKMRLLSIFTFFELSSSFMAQSYKQQYAEKL
jgi:hypothetical protein